MNGNQAQKTIQRIIDAGDVICPRIILKRKINIRLDMSDMSIFIYRLIKWCWTNTQVSIFIFLEIDYEKKELRFSFLVTLVEKKGSKRLAKNEWGESQASYLRRLIRQISWTQGFQAYKGYPGTRTPCVRGKRSCKNQDKVHLLWRGAKWKVINCSDPEDISRTWMFLFRWHINCCQVAL